MCTLSHNILYIVSDNAQKYKKKMKNLPIGRFFGEQDKRSSRMFSNGNLKTPQLFTVRSLFFIPKSAAPIPAARGTASITPMELATAEISSTAK